MIGKWDYDYAHHRKSSRSNISQRLQGACLLSKAQNMTVYLNRHYIAGDTRHDIADTHQKELAVKDRYQVKLLTYCFDEMRSTTFCLVETPNRQAIEHAHDEAHGSIPNEVLEADPAVVDTFLGSIKD